ncbi:MAG: PVC-type heme-binding CxxCH protein [Opitutaceae bacterium]
MLPSRLLLPLCLLLLAAAPAGSPAAEPPRFTPELEDFVRHFKPGGQDFAGQARVLPPEESVRRMQVPDGYAVELVASEPAVCQPIDLRFDARGRLWVIQYLQYPFPAGLTVTAYDQYIRAEFNRGPPAPPRHTRGADRISILEDRDGDGRFETVKTFVDGLNLATSVLPDADGVWVLMSPYLLFYPDRNGDDVPDGDPEVHLAGFGLEDTHSLASSLHWGPDGWIYGATGSTTNLEIQGIRLLGQGIWRYHPATRVFEVFAEGGGNTFSLEFDQYGRAFSGTNNGATRGLHYAQGATYVKGWTKHGPAMNPFLFGFFEHMAHEGYGPRFPQTFILYEADLFPELNGQVVVGMSLTNRVQASRLLPQASTFRTIDSAALITTDDRTFRPVDIEQGPDGAIYLADWSDPRLSHLNPKDTWDKATGRIVRLVPKGVPLPRPEDLTRLDDAALLARLNHPNREHREHARRLLARRPAALTAPLRTLVAGNAPAALEAFWVLNLRHELEERDLRSALAHPNAHLRRWAVRLLGDRGVQQAATAAALAERAAVEPDAEVRSQFASSARRLRASQGIPVVRALLRHAVDANDRHLPLLLWWALESHAEDGREELLGLVSDPATWRAPTFRRELAERLGRRFTADQGPRRHYTLRQGVYSEWIIERAPEHLRRNLEFCARLLAAAPGPEEAVLLVQGMARGLTGPRVTAPPPALLAAVASAWAKAPDHVALTTLAARLGVAEAERRAIVRLREPRLAEADQQVLLDLVSALGTPEALPLLTEQFRTERNEARRARRLAALAGFDQPVAAAAVIDGYASLGPRLQTTALRHLAEKPAWARLMLERMAAGSFSPGALGSATLATLRAHPDPAVQRLLEGHLRTPASAAGTQAALLHDAGRTAYNLTCAPCHQESGSGLVGLAPALAGSPWLQRSDEVLVNIILHGKENPGRGLVMPPWRQLDDAQIAAILTYVRREFGNDARLVSPVRVKELRAAAGSRDRPWSDRELEALAGGR